MAPDPDPPDPAITSITRQTARSGVGYAVEDVVLHATSRRQILLRPWYIPHKTKEHALACKLLDQEWRGGFWQDKAEVNLDEDATQHLRNALDQHSAVARSGESGKLLLIRSSGIVPSNEAEAGELMRAVLGLLGRADVLAQFAHEDLAEEIVAALQGSLRLQQLRRAIGQLRKMLESGVVAESEYQQWCQRHAWAFGNAHTVPDEIRRVTRTDDVDILLPRVLTGFRDIIELKRPDHRVLVRDGRRHTIFWSTEASQAIGQCREYMDNLHEDAQNGLRGRPEVVAYHPRATIVIGRSQGWPDDESRALAGLNHRLVGISIMTYDHLLAQGDELIRVFTDEVEAESG
jgi:hypothetical protein